MATVRKASWLVGLASKYAGAEQAIKARREAREQAREATKALAEAEKALVSALPKDIVVACYRIGEARQAEVASLNEALKQAKARYAADLAALAASAAESAHANAAEAEMVGGACFLVEAIGHGEAVKKARVAH